MHLYRCILLSTREFAPKIPVIIGKHSVSFHSGVPYAEEVQIEINTQIIYGQHQYIRAGTIHVYYEHCTQL